MASFKVDKSQLDQLIAKMENPVIQETLKQLPMNKGLVALVAQAIADNFDKEGPGWAPLSPKTIRMSTAKKMGTGATKKDKRRMILQRTGALKKSVTTPGAMHNVWKNEGTNLVWGTDLAYAGIHNYGWPARGIPKREFLVIREEWQTRLNEFILQKASKLISTQMGGT